MFEPVTTANGRHRRRRERPGPPDGIDTWPPAWRQLALSWVRRASANNSRCKWETLLAAAGGSAFETAHDLLEALLRGGWVGVDEAWRDGRWQPLWIEFGALPELRAALGMPDPLAQQAAMAQNLAALLADPAAAAFHQAADDAATLRPALALARLELLAALVRWNAPAQATHRDFAQFARGDTKAITGAEWDWLDAHVDLTACGIGGHAPLLCIAAPIVLTLPRGSLNLDAAPDFIALPPAPLDATSAINGQISEWTLVENRTSFERVARNRGADQGVLWLPGFAPGWWRTAIARLLQLSPAPARIACDPDPAGIEIATNAGALWHVAGLDWQPWRMSAADLVGLACRKPLSEHDMRRLAALNDTALPPMLRDLAETLAATGEKGEQEGYL
jgi:hypothetical protein